MSEKSEEQLRSEIMVLKDVIRRSGWYLGTDKQALPPTLEQLREFHHEVKEVLGCGVG